MARFEVLSWHGIPSQVRASDERGLTVRRQLPGSFQQEIDRVAMARGLSEGDAYLEGWSWSELAERAGSAEEVADAVVHELVAAWERGERPAEG